MQPQTWFVSGLPRGDACRYSLEVTPEDEVTPEAFDKTRRPPTQRLESKAECKTLLFVIERVVRTAARAKLLCSANNV